MTELYNNSELMDEAISNGFAAIDQSCIPAGAAERLVEYGQQVVVAHPEVMAAAASAVATKIAKIVLSVVTALGVAAGVYVYNQAEEPEITPPAQVVETEPIVVEPSEDTNYVFSPVTSIAFEGGERAEHINPYSASASTSEGTITQWAVLDAAQANVLQGEGASTGAALAQLPQGSYTIYFYIVDDHNTTAMVERAFSVK